MYYKVESKEGKILFESEEKKAAVAYYLKNKKSLFQKFETEIPTKIIK